MATAEPLPPLPIEATLRAAMDDLGTGWWSLLLVGLAGFVPLWAIVAALGDHPASSLVQFAALVPTAALLSAAGAVRADRPATLGASYRRALRRLLDYLLANLVVGVAVFLIAIGPVLVVVAAAVLFLAVDGTGDPGPFVAVVVLAALAAVVPLTFVSTRLALVGPIVVVEGLGVGEALTETWRRTRHQVIRLLIVFVVGSIPGVLFGLGAALVGFGLLGQPALAGAALGIGYAVGVALVACLNVVAWQRLGGTTDRLAASPPPPPRARDRGPLTAILLLSAGLLLMTVGSMAAVGKVGGWLDALAGQQSGVITYGIGGLGCLQLDERTDFEAGESIHAVAVLTMAVPDGERLAYEVYADSVLIDRGFETPFAEATSCVFFDLQTTDIEPAIYTFRYLWGPDVLAEGSFRISDR